MNSRRRLLALPLCAALAACSGGVSIGIGGGSNVWGGWGWDDGWDSVDFAVIDSSGASGIASAGLIVARDISAWAQLWADHTANLAAPPLLPSVNFASQMVAGVFAGPRTSACARLQVRRVLRERATGRLRIEVSEGIDAAGCLPAGLAATPAVLLALPWTTASVDYVRID
ncbi:hypothetical protein [Derxia lacustris]|uniref:hypothetical protein n=1 Tax=Derxia lacustris TaxID=764842 RepID=UPI000A173149|nr:hypothetical protein [Derxia lacustris]